MKDFLKTTLAVILGIVIVSVVSGFLSVIALVGLASASSASGTNISPNSILKMDMSKLVVAEQTRNFSGSLNLGSSISFDAPESIGIWDAVQALNAAAADPKIQCVYLKVDGLSGGITTIQELRKALNNFRQSGKPVIAYTEAPSTGSYYLASVADKVYITPYQGTESMITGLSGRLIFLKDLLDKFGVNVQLIRHGKYKSAGEMYTRSSASPENMEQNQVMINSIWESLASEICASRGISVEQLDALINDLKLDTADDFIENKLADEKLNREELQQKLASLAMVDSFKEVKMVSLKEYSGTLPSPKITAKNKIAVIYVDGEIVDGKEKQEVAGDRFASEIAKVRADSTVKVVVLRVNSPGGSVIASEKIKAELDLLKQDKRIVASYANYAASGGYWISNNADKIYTNPTTLTGSIGVFGMVPDFSKTVKDVAHVTITPVKSHKHSDMFSLMRPFDSDEYAYMQRSIESVYDTFVNMVAQSRSMEPEQVDELAQGRVWTGSDALKIGLVDEIGTLEDAVRYAAGLAGNDDLSQWSVVGYPKPASPFEEVLSMFGGKTTGDDEMMAFAKNLTAPRTLARMPFEFSIQ